MPRLDLRNWLVILVSVVLLTTGLTSCTSGPALASTSDSGRVGSTGFSLETKDATATAGAGVAAKNTKVTLVEVKHSFTSPAVSDLSSLGTPVRLRLDKDAQPKKPITIRLKIDKSMVSKDDWSKPQTYAILTQSVGANASGLLPATYDSKTGYLVATTDHLSWFEPVQLVLSSFISNLGTTVLHAIGVEYDSPDCSGKELSTALDGVTYTTSGSWAVDPCLSIDNGKLRLKLYSTTGLPFQVTSTPTGATSPLPGLSATSLAQQVTFDLLFSEKNANFIGPGGELDYTYSSAGATTLSFVQAPAMLYVATLIDVLSFLAPEKSVAKEALDHLDSLDCMTQIVSAAQSAKTLTTGLAGQIVSSFISCAGKAFTDPKDSVIWAMATAAPSLLVNMALGIVTEIGGKGSFQINIKALAPQPVLAAASAFGPSPNYSEGFGTVKPKFIFNGGDPTGAVENIVWQSWGGDVAIGYGTGCDASHSEGVADCPTHRARVIASNLGTCDGKRAYMDVGWYFPGYDGETDETARADDIRDCNYG